MTPSDKSDRILRLGVGFFVVVEKFHWVFPCCNHQRLLTFTSAQKLDRFDGGRLDAKNAPSSGWKHSAPKNHEGRIQKGRN
mmetsp:Transcript_9036/g.20883  ORF Transcript_9036/g.20883 Transcript_9036/m.20883 type:complete len:81 (+) Transcript_9036:625-867(+)